MIAVAADRFRQALDARDVLEQLCLELPLSGVDERDAARALHDLRSILSKELRHREAAALRAVRALGMHVIPTAPTDARNTPQADGDAAA